MKIGILGCFYNCEDLLPHVLEPWIKLKEQGLDISISVINAQFSEYAELGYERSDNATQRILREHQNYFDSLIISDSPLREHEARTKALTPLLEKGVDIVWLLDGDELYSIENIQNIISYVEETAFDYYHIHFNNRIFDTIEWKDDFFPPRIFRTDRHGGLEKFTWDNEIRYKDKTDFFTIIPGIIPKKDAFVNHFTWRRKDAKKKIAYHKKHFGLCMYKLDDKGELIPDVEYFTYHQMPLPITEADGSLSTVRKKRIDVLFRSHASGNFRQGIARVTDTLGGKAELSIRSLRSLINALLILERVNDYTLSLTIIDDHSNDDFLDTIKRELHYCPFETSVISLKDRGNEASFSYTLNYAKNREQDFLYFVEDDYLHEPTALLEMLRSYELFSHHLRKENIGLFPVDQTDYYLPNLIELTRVVPGSHRHWRVSTTSTCTFFLPRSVFADCFELLLKATALQMSEWGTINAVWQTHAILFSPIPTLAYHVHGQEQMPHFSNWMQLWNSLQHATGSPKSPKMGVD